MTTDQLNALMLATLLALAPAHAFILWQAVKAKRRSRGARQRARRALEEVKGVDGDGI